VVTPAIPPTALPIPDMWVGRRVLVRPYEITDAAALMEAVAESREELRPWMPWAEAHQTLEEAMDWCARSKADWITRRNMNMGIWQHCADDASDPMSMAHVYVGGSGFHRMNWDARNFEIGYWRRTGAGGRGLVTESTRVLTRAAFEELNANRVEIRCDSRNTASRAVAERCGFVLEGLLRRTDLAEDGSLRDTLVFSLMREEFLALLPSWRESFLS
jgi:RimJ/RimL family protein N-acetyltransferase